MKTQIFTTRTITTIAALLIVAFTATQATAQRREQNNNSENTKKAIIQANKSVVKERKTRKENVKPVTRNNDQNQNGANRRERKEVNSRNDHNNGDKVENHNRDGNRNDHNNNWKNNREDRYRNHDNHNNWRPGTAPDFRVHADPPHFHERDYMWHRHNYVSYRTLPRRAVWVLIDGENYAFYHGRFYLPGPFGFYRVTPPVYLHNLPDNCMQVLIDGQPMWRLQGILFIETPLGFKIII
jgi:hypothetical protein